MNKIQKTTQKAATVAILVVTEASIAAIVGLVMISSVVFGFALWIKRMATKAKTYFGMKR